MGKCYSKNNMKTAIISPRSSLNNVFDIEKINGKEVTLSKYKLIHSRGETKTKKVNIIIDVNKKNSSIKCNNYIRTRDVLEIAQEVSDLLCVICLENYKDMIIVPCGHQCICSKCSYNLLYFSETEYKCPICRKRIDTVIKVFF